jgi:hypothetical protein
MTQSMIDIPAELAAMEKMAAKALRTKYEDLFGEPSRSGNRQWLLRRCAWRLQSQVEGTLSDRAFQRAKALARDADIRLIPPDELPALPSAEPPDHRQPARKYIKTHHDPRLPMPGANLCRVYKGQEHKVHVTANGFEYDGKRYHSLSAVAHAITGSHWNGYLFFNIAKPGKEPK